MTSGGNEWEEVYIIYILYYIIIYDALQTTKIYS